MNQSTGEIFNDFKDLQQAWHDYEHVTLFHYDSECRWLRLVYRVVDDQSVYYITDMAYVEKAFSCGYVVEVVGYCNHDGGLHVISYPDDSRLDGKEIVEL